MQTVQSERRKATKRNLLEKAALRFDREECHPYVKKSRARHNAVRLLVALDLIQRGS